MVSERFSLFAKVQKFRKTKNINITPNLHCGRSSSRSRHAEELAINWPSAPSWPSASYHCVSPWCLTNVEKHTEIVCLCQGLNWNWVCWASSASVKRRLWRQNWFGRLQSLPPSRFSKFYSLHPGFCQVQQVIQVTANIM